MICIGMKVIVTDVTLMNLFFSKKSTEVCPIKVGDIATVTGSETDEEGTVWVAEFPNGWSFYVDESNVRGLPN